MHSEEMSRWLAEGLKALMAAPHVLPEEDEEATGHTHADLFRVPVADGASDESSEPAQEQDGDEDPAVTLARQLKESMYLQICKGAQRSLACVI